MPYAEGTPTVEVTLGGRPYTVGYTWGVKRRIREKLQEKGLDAAGNQEEYLAITLWSGLDAEARATLSVEDVEELISPTNEQVIVLKLQELIVRSEPEPDPNAVPSAAKTPTEGERSQLTISGRLVSTT